jgi:hypothetical protein
LRLGLLTFAVTCVAASVPTVLYFAFLRPDASQTARATLESTTARSISDETSTAIASPSPRPDADATAPSAQNADASARDADDAGGTAFMSFADAEVRDVGEDTGSAGDAGASRSTEELIAAATKTLDAGEQIGEELVKGLRAIALTTETDARPALLLARYRLNRGHYTDALDRYELAYDTDPESRREPTMLPNLIRLVKSKAVGARASLMIRRMYGREAIDAVTRALNDQGLEQSEASALRRLLTSLERLPP